MYRLVKIACLLFLLFGCKKPEDRTCIKSTGEAASKTIALTGLNFNGISTNNDLNINLIPDSVNFLTIHSYQNTINQITFQVEDTLLVLKDESKCGFLRNNYKRTTIDVHYNSISVLSINGNGKISAHAPISNQIVHIYSQSSNGEIDLSVNAASLVVKLVNGTLNGQLKGTANNANIFHFGYSNVNFEQLNVDHLSVTNKSDANLYVLANLSLAVELFSLGNIYYKGNPTTEVLANTMGSKLINNN